MTSKRPRGRSMDDSGDLPMVHRIGPDRVLVWRDRLVIESPIDMEFWEVRTYRHTLIRFLDTEDDESGQSVWRQHRHDQLFRGPSEMSRPRVSGAIEKSAGSETGADPRLDGLRRSFAASPW